MIMGTNESIDTINTNVTAWGERKDSTGREYQFYEFWIDGEYDLYYGYSLAGALRDEGLSEDEWECYRVDEVFEEERVW